MQEFQQTRTAFSLFINIFSLQQFIYLRVCSIQWGKSRHANTEQRKSLKIEIRYLKKRAKLSCSSSANHNGQHKMFSFILYVFGCVYEGILKNRREKCWLPAKKSTRNQRQMLFTNDSRQQHKNRQWWICILNTFSRRVRRVYKSPRYVRIYHQLFLLHSFPSSFNQHLQNHRSQQPLP